MTKWDSAGMVFLELPELVLQVAAYLPPADAASLGLTCRKLFSIISMTRVYAELQAKRIAGFDCTIPDYFAAPYESQRWQLLEMLETDLPGYSLCHYCRILHRTPCAWQAHSGISWWKLGRVTFADAYQVMLRYRKGKGYGHPLSSLTVSTDWVDHPYTWGYGRPCDVKNDVEPRKVKLEVEAAVVRGSLLLHTTQRLRIITKKRHFDGSLGRQGPYSYGFQTCRHDYSFMPHRHVDARYSLGVDESIVNHWFDMSRHRHPHWKTLCYIFNISRKRLFRYLRLSPPQACGEITQLCCAYCPTSTRLETYDHGWRGVEAVLDVWQNLGRCESPSDTEWSLCWQLPCLRHKRDHCPRFTRSGVPNRKARLKMSEWVGQGNERPRHGSWCSLPMGGSGME